MHHDLDYIRCDTPGCSKLFTESKGKRTHDGMDLCPLCARKLMGGGLEDEISAPIMMEPFIRKRYRHFGDNFDKT